MVAGNGIKEEEVVKAIAVGRRRAIDMMENSSRGNINIIFISGDELTREQRAGTDSHMNLICPVRRDDGQMIVNPSLL